MYYRVRRSSSVPYLNWIQQLSRRVYLCLVQVFWICSAPPTPTALRSTTLTARTDFATVSLATTPLMTRFAYLTVFCNRRAAVVQVYNKCFLMQVCSVRIIGSLNCRNNTDCTLAVDNSACEGGTCLCVSGYGTDPDSSAGDECLPGAWISVWRHNYRVIFIFKFGSIE